MRSSVWLPHRPSFLKCTPVCHIAGAMSSYRKILFGCVSTCTAEELRILPENLMLNLSAHVYFKILFVMENSNCNVSFFNTISLYVFKTKRYRFGFCFPFSYMYDAFLHFCFSSVLHPPYCSDRHRAVLSSIGSLLLASSELVEKELLCILRWRKEE